MILLIDLDSILYTAVYKIVSFRAMKESLIKFGKESAKQWLNEEVYNEGINRCENELLKIQKQVDSMMINDITGIELFITTCSNSFRKKVSKTYKSNRKKNKYVWLLRAHYQMNGAFFDDELEADDLISLRAKELGVDNCVIVSIDKDLKQIGGYYWSYYKMKSKDYYGNPIINEYGFQESEFKQKEIDYITKDEADFLFWQQMLVGDASDNIKGVNRIGTKTSEKILNNTRCNWFAVARKYIEKNQKQDFYINYQLLKLK